MTEPLKILILEDDPFDAEIIQRLLRKEPWNMELTLVTTRNDYETALGRFHPDLILADNSLPQFDAGEAYSLPGSNRSIFPLLW